MSVRSIRRARVRGSIANARRLGAPTAERDPRQGGGKLTRTAPAVRRARRRKANVIAKASRRANR